MSVQSEITRLENAKTAIGTAIANKGVTVPADTKLDGMAELIGNISVGQNTNTTQTLSGSVIAIDNCVNAPLNGLKLFGKTTQNGTPTPTSPVELVSVGNSGTINTTMRGENLFPKASAGVKTQNGITLTSNGNGSYTVKGTSTGAVTLKFALEESVVLREGMHVHMMNNVSASALSFVYWYGDSTSSYWSLYSVNRIGTPTKNFGKTITQVGIQIASGNTVDVTFSPMFVYSNTKMDFVPYQSIQTLTASTPNGLPGIPVTSGGNYTDENGQAWICDEIDFARGVYVQRIIRCSSWTKMSTLTNTELYACPTNTACLGGTSGVAMCNVTNVYGYNQNDTVHMYMSPSTTNGTANIYVPVGYDMVANPVEMLVAMATPVETALSAEELAAFAALHTHNQRTIVENDAGADMEIVYHTSYTGVETCEVSFDLSCETYPIKIHYTNGNMQNIIHTVSSFSFVGTLYCAKGTGIFIGNGIQTTGECQYIETSGGVSRPYSKWPFLLVNGNGSVEYAF